MSARRRVAFVVDRCTARTFGGAPLWAHAFARHLDACATTEVLTTTAEDYMTWANAVAPGVAALDGVTVRRFAVDRQRDVRAFDRLSRRLADDPRPSAEAQARWLRSQGPCSSGLLTYLGEHAADYDAFVFVSYLYATTAYGLPLVADRALLVPLAHDEWMLRLPMWDRLFGLARGFVYNTEEERAFTAQRFPALATDGPIIAPGIERPLDVEPPRFRRAYGIERPFALYLGRVDPSKGCEELLRAYAAYRRDTAGALDLVLIGERYAALGGPGVHVLGAVDDRTKWDALAACDLLVLPSALESLSLAVLEAWASGKPALVNARAPAVVGQCRRSGAGLWYADDDQFVAALQLLDAATGCRLGARGADFVRARYRWDDVVSAFAAHLASTLAW